MSALFRRKIELRFKRTTIDSYRSESVADELVIRNMAVRFEIEKSDGSEPNKCTIEIDNLNDQNRQFVCMKPSQMQIIAGYEDNARLLFVGDLKHGFPRIEGPTVVTSLEYGDGMRAYAHARAPSKSYRGGTSVKRALRDVAASMGQSLPRNIELSTELDRPFNGGIALSGLARDELTKMLGPYGYSWSIQNGTLQVLRDEDVRDNTTYIVEPNNGLVGSPVWSVPEKPGSKPKLTFATLLYPELLPGCKVQIRSRFVNGTVKATSVKHTGDTDGAEWTTTVEAESFT